MEVSRCDNRIWVQQKEAGIEAISEPDSDLSGSRTKIFFMDQEILMNQIHHSSRSQFDLR